MFCFAAGRICRRVGNCLRSTVCRFLRRVGGILNGVSSDRNLVAHRYMGSLCVLGNLSCNALSRSSSFFSENAGLMLPAAS